MRIDCGTSCVGGSSFLLRLIAACAIGLLPVSTAMANLTLPNVLLILVDDVGMEFLDFYSLDGPDGDYASTPNLTRRFNFPANNFLRFDDAWSNPVCSPTRATILSGKYGFRTGIGGVVKTDTDWGLDVLNPDLDLLPALLKTAIPAYTTAAFGKWHLGTGEPPNQDQGGNLAPNNAGFDRYEGTLIDEQGDPCTGRVLDLL